MKNFYERYNTDSSSRYFNHITANRTYSGPADEEHVVDEVIVGFYQDEILDMGFGSCTGMINFIWTSYRDGWLEVGKPRYVVCMSLSAGSNSFNALHHCADIMEALAKLGLDERITAGEFCKILSHDLKIKNMTRY